MWWPTACRSRASARGLRQWLPSHRTRMRRMTVSIGYWLRYLTSEAVEVRAETVGRIRLTTRFQRTRGPAST